MFYSFVVGISKIMGIWGTYALKLFSKDFNIFTVFFSHHPPKIMLIVADGFAIFQFIRQWNWGLIVFLQFTIKQFDDFTFDSVALLLRLFTFTSSIQMMFNNIKTLVGEALLPPPRLYFIWRRRRDSNSRAGFPTYTLSRGASSAYLSTSP